ncbi:MAG: hypothetical protein DSO04_07790 [Hadesarchaea archaeon]|jgi:ribosomal-protein-alanine N-acetyltransferase|nr:MAG: hypothetical protein DSO04_07790 [Hadesarchaea archaeon]
MGGGYELREATEEDAGKVEALARLCQPLRASVKGTYEYLALCFPRYFLLAFSGEQLVGFVVGLPSLAGEAWIYQICVHPDHRRRRVGELLMEEELGRFRSDRFPRVRARVLETNQPSLSLMRKMGLRERGKKGEWVELEREL